MLPVPVIPLPDLTSSDHDRTAEATVVYVDPAPMPTSFTVRIQQPSIPFHDHSSTHENSVPDWDAYVGQDRIKRKLRVHIDSALATMEPLPHTLLDSGMPGVGKTTLARLIAKELGVKITSMVPPFSAETLYDAMLQMQDWDILFIDEIHKLADHGPQAAENLYTAMEEGMIYLEDGPHKLNDFTFIGATTNGSKLPRAVVDRFTIKPYFRKYTDRELIKIAYTNFCKRYDVELTPQTLVAIAKACRGTPRVARDFVVDAKALQRSLRRQCTPQELLEFSEVEPDGMTQKHIAYILGLYQFGRSRRADDTIEWVMGEATLLMFLDEDKFGLSRLERFLIEKGLVQKTRRGRVLTDNGVLKARTYIQQGKALNSE